MKYRIHIQYSAEDDGYVAKVPELPGCSAFGDTAEEAVREVQVAAAGWVDTARQLQREIPKPSAERAYSGKLVLRMPPELHRELDAAATDAHASLNQYLVFLLARAIGQYEATRVIGSWTSHIDLLSMRAWEQFSQPTRHLFARNVDAVRDPFEKTIRDLLQEEHKSHFWSYRSYIVSTRTKKKVPAEGEE